jgi:membrane fusion protein (multidrug efflux system)
VVTERTVGDKWLVSKGLQPGDRLIVEGLGRIQPGQSVKPVAVATPAVAAPTPAATPASTG